MRTKHFDHPASRHDLEPWFCVGSPDHLDGEVEEGSLVHQLLAIIGAIGEEVLHPWLTLAYRFQDHLGAGGV